VRTGPGWADPDMGSGQELGAQWQYGKLASLAYQLDKPIGTSFGDVEFYQGLLSGVTGELLEPAVGTGRMLIPLLEQGRDAADHRLAPV
jgi:hypothetical protein